MVVATVPPVDVGAGSVTFTVIVALLVLDVTPSDTVYVNVGDPICCAAGTKVSSPLLMSDTVTTWFVVTAVPLSNNVPLVASPVIATECSVSFASGDAR